MDQSILLDYIKHLFTIWSLIEVALAITFVIVIEAVYGDDYRGNCCDNTYSKKRGWSPPLSLCVVLTTTQWFIHNLLLLLHINFATMVTIN